MPEELQALTKAPSQLTTAAFPVVLLIGKRRGYTRPTTFSANRFGGKRDAGGAVRVNIEDAHALGLTSRRHARITTAAGNTETTVEITEKILLPRCHSAAQRIWARLHRRQ
ncbi:hypothetical protein [Mycobacterium lepromatosis]|nr:hypothetical protein [Mycobacterium lepromatosis]